MATSEKKHLPTPGVRHALICEKCDPPVRVFGKPDWRCPVHPKAKPTHQVNQPYFGQSTA